MEAKRPSGLRKVVALEKINNLFEVSFQLQNKGIANVFLDFQAHVQWINIRVYVGGWATGLEGIRHTLYIGADSFSEDHYEYIMQELTELYNGEISFEEIQKKREEEELERKRKEYEKLKAEFEPNPPETL